MVSFEAIHILPLRLICFLTFSSVFCVQDDSPPLTFPYLQRMQTDPPAGVSASPVADNVMTWYVSSALCFEVLVLGNGSDEMSGMPSSSAPPTRRSKMAHSAWS